MKVLLIHNRYRHEGGEEEAVASLAELLSSKGHEVHRWEHSSHEWSDHSAAQWVGDALGMIHSRSIAAELRVMLTRVKPDLVHVHNLFPVLSPSVLKTAKEFQLPIVQTLHNYRWLCANGLFLTPRGSICTRCKNGNFISAVRFGCYNGRLKTIPMALSLAYHRWRHTPERKVDCFIAPSRFLRDQYVNAGWPHDRIDVVPNPIRLMAPQAPSKAQEPLFIYAGRLSYEKGIRTLLKAFQRGAPGKLLLLGDGPLKPECLKASSDRIEVSGRVSHETVLERLAQAWALIMPSECYENLPQSVLESWMCGTPVVASRLGGLAELIQEGQTGWTFEPGNAEDLILKLRQLVDQPNGQQTYSEQCRTRALQDYSAETLYPKIMAVYQKAIERC